MGNDTAGGDVSHAFGVGGLFGFRVNLEDGRLEDHETSIAYRHTLSMPPRGHSL